MNTQLAQASIFDMIAAAGPVGKFVLFVLLLASLYTWSIIFAKWRALKLAVRQNADFEQMFWNTKKIDEVFSKSSYYGRSPIAQVFRSGFKELKRISPTEFVDHEESSVESISRALSRGANAEMAKLENKLGWLATTASAAPFVGLFGTVWGIMDSFHKIGLTGSANLAVVAPGISEALIATAVGIGVAIPAVVGYNHFSGLVRRQATDIDSFSQDFLNIVHHSWLNRRKTPPGPPQG